MNNFIWVRDKDKTQHYINVYFVRVTKVPASGTYPEYGYMVLNEPHRDRINLSDDQFDTVDEVVSKIRKVEMS